MPNHKSLHWTGIAFGAITLLFMMGLVLIHIFWRELGEFNEFVRFAVFGTFSLGVGLSAGFLGGGAAVSGQLPIEFATKHPLQFGAAGGVGALIVVFVICVLAFPASDSEPGSDLVAGPVVGANPGGVDAGTENGQNGNDADRGASPALAHDHSCFHFQPGARDFIRYPESRMVDQVDHIKGIVERHGSISISAWVFEEMSREDAMILSQMRVRAVRDYLVGRGVSIDTIRLVSHGAEGLTWNAAALNADIQEPVCQARITPGMAVVLQ